jgi:aspartate/methionine/tyrosine aminotransferase
MFTFARLDRLPPYVFATVNKIKMKARRAGKDIIDLGMGNPDLGAPRHIVDKLVESAQKPHNPTTEVVDLTFFQKVVDYAKEHNIMVIHDFAYADLVFDGYKAPSFLQAKGAKKDGVAVSPGLGFGEYGDEYVRFALIENPMRINQAVRGIRRIM